MTTFQEHLRTSFLDYFCNYLTVAKFAEHNNITDTDAQVIIDMGRKYHEEYAKLHEEYAKLWAELDEEYARLWAKLDE